jgi:hypothetical protein
MKSPARSRLSARMEKYSDDETMSERVSVKKKRDVDEARPQQDDAKCTLLLVTAALVLFSS